MTSPRETSPQPVLVNVGEIGAMPKENRVSKERGGIMFRVNSVNSFGKDI